MFALNAVEPAEEAQIEVHLAGCGVCHREVARHLEVASALSTAERSAPPALWESISSTINPTGIEPVARSAVARHPWSGKWRWPPAIAAALTLLAGATVVQSVRLATANTDLAEALNRSIGEAAAAQSSVEPATRRVTLGSQASGSNATIVLLPDGTGYLAEHTLQPLSPDRTYQLWAIVDGKVISAGVLGQDPGVILFRIDPEGLDGFAITEETVGGVEVSGNDPVVAWLAT